MAECILAQEYPGGVVVIDSGMVRPQMAACYLLETDSAVAVIETGNNASTPRILSVLAHRGRRVEEVSHVIVTHVHLDHAGGAGSLMRELPNATLFVHPRGARHMVDPSRLESSARAVYGDEEYEAQHGPLIPVPEDRMQIADEGDAVYVGKRRLEFIDAPGHARHHFCVWDEQTGGWFTGDNFGICYPDLATARGPFIIPTTTPIQFDPPRLLETIGRLLERKPRNLYLTHFGRVQDIERLADDLRAGVEQFVAWGESFADAGDRRERIATAMMDWMVEGALAHGVERDVDELRALLAPDVDLNTQGIEFWLDHGR